MNNEYNKEQPEEIYTSFMLAYKKFPQNSAPHTSLFLTECYKNANACLYGLRKGTIL